MLVWAFGAIPKVEAVWTATVEVVFYGEGFAGGVAANGVTGNGTGSGATGNGGGVVNVGVVGGDVSGGGLRPIDVEHWVKHGTTSPRRLSITEDKNDAVLLTETSDVAYSSSLLVGSLR